MHDANNEIRRFFDGYGLLKGRVTKVDGDKHKIGYYDGDKYLIHVNKVEWTFFTTKFRKAGYPFVKIFFWKGRNITFNFTMEYVLNNDYL